MAAKIKVDQIETVDATDSITINNTVVMASGKTLPAASLTGTLPAISGANLTNLPADATKLPLAGGTMTGNLAVTRGSGNAVTRFQGASNSQSSKLFVSHVSSGDGGLYYNSNYMDIFSYSDMRFNVGTANVSGSIGNERMVIKNNGKVGIGVTALTRQLAIGTLGTKTDTATKYVMNIGQTTESSGHAGLGVYFAGHANAASRKWQFQPAEAGVANDGIIEMNPDGGYFRANRGVLFGTDTAAANILDDYEEGTFTPAASGGASSTSGSYTKIGRLVTCHGTLTFPSQTNSGHAQVEGLPFTTVNADGFSGFIRYTNYNPKQIMMHGNPNSTTFGLYEVDYGSSVTQVSWTEISGIRFDFTVVYFAA